MSQQPYDSRAPFFLTLEELIANFTDDDGPPKVFHGYLTMLGIYPVDDDLVHWFSWTARHGGLEYQFSDDEYPQDATLWEDEEDEDEA